MHTTDIAANMAVIRNLPLKEETKRDILGGNAARLLGIAEHPLRGV